LLSGIGVVSLCGTMYGKHSDKCHSLVVNSKGGSIS
jgi:hypothetical protein